MLEQAPQPLLAPDLAARRPVGPWRWLAALGHGYRGLGRGHVAQALVRPDGVMVADVALRDVVEMPEAEAEEVVQASTSLAAFSRPPRRRS